jgi:putative transposase
MRACEQSGKVYNAGVYFSRQVFFKTEKMLLGKYDLDFEPSVSKTLTARSMPSTPMQQVYRKNWEEIKDSFKQIDRTRGHIKKRSPSKDFDR